MNAGVISVRKNIVPTMSGIKASVIRTILEILFLPNKVYVVLSSTIKALHRMYVSKQKLLEWMTAEEAEKQSKTDLGSHFKFMWLNVLMGILFASFGIIGVDAYIDPVRYGNLPLQIFALILGILW
ncbi:MAG: hypothetical protein FWC68_01295, partial [Oscillospiraceae bacterium]|nr:hypothetical protein [Oscillospiraceae bacterium]